jgi:hypothetical protein
MRQSESPTALEIINELLSWVMHGYDSPKAPKDSKLINELLSRVTHGFDSATSPYGLRYHQRTAVTGAPWIRQPEQPLGGQISSTNCCHG